jgi:hypothetical protein
MQRHIGFGIELHKLCDMSGHTYDMAVYLGKEKADVTSTHAN